MVLSSFPHLNMDEFIDVVGDMNLLVKPQDKIDNPKVLLLKLKQVRQNLKLEFATYPDASWKEQN